MDSLAAAPGTGPATNPLPILRKPRPAAKFEDLPTDRTLVMGILNVTPDSFSDGGTHPTPDTARSVNRAGRGYTATSGPLAFAPSTPGRPGPGAFTGAHAGVRRHSESLSTDAACDVQDVRLGVLNPVRSASSFARPSGSSQALA